MLVDVDGTCAVLDRLPLGQEPAYRQMLRDGRLKCEGPDGIADYADDLNARVVVDFLRTRASSSLLIILPDEAQRRSAIALSAALVLEGVSQIRTKAKYGSVVHVSNDPGVRAHLKGVRLGRWALETVFTQQYAKGDVADLRTLSSPGGLHLPRVLLLCAPADPATVLRSQKPLWITVDLGDGERVDWLEELVVEARRAQVPVVAWTSSPFATVLDEWKRLGGGVFAWPRLIATSMKGIVAPVRDHLMPLVTLKPLVVAGDGALPMTTCFAAAVEALAAARASSSGRLASDALSVAWRFLRTLEAMPVHVEDHERDVASFWGVDGVERLATSLDKFLDVLAPTGGAVGNELQAVADALQRVRTSMTNGVAPLWNSLVNLCVESPTGQVLVFSSRARKEMFRQAMLARLNISEDDLLGLGMRLTYVSDANRARANGARYVFVGLPSRERLRMFSRYFDGGQIAVVMWPHQCRQFESQVRQMNERLNMSVHALDVCYPRLAALLATASATHLRSFLRTTEKEPLVGVTSGEEVGATHEIVNLWKRPELSDAIAALLGEASSDDTDAQTARVALDDDNPTDVEDPVDLWVDEIVELTFGNSRRLLLASDDTVNVIARVLDKTRLEERYVRGVRPGDEILFIRGQQRQTLYELLVSRVHRNPVVAQYIQLVERWQGDFARAFATASRAGLTEEVLLVRLREMGSGIISVGTIRNWVKRAVLAPLDADDLLRVAKYFSLSFVTEYYKAIHIAGRRLKGLHIHLSARLNRWLASGDAASATEKADDDIIDGELGLTVDDFRQSLLRLRVVGAKTISGRYYRGSLGRLEGAP